MNSFIPERTPDVKPRAEKPFPIRRLEIKVSSPQTEIAKNQELYKMFTFNGPKVKEWEDIRILPPRLNISKEDEKEIRALLKDTPREDVDIILEYLDHNPEKIQGFLNKSVPVDKKQERKEGCYIATMVYGDYDAPEVLVLRSFRDKVLLRSWYGRTFVRIYYYISPKLVKVLAGKQKINKLIKNQLDLLIKHLKTRQL